VTLGLEQHSIKNWHGQVVNNIVLDGLSAKSNQMRHSGHLFPGWSNAIHRKALRRKKGKRCDIYSYSFLLLHWLC